MRDGGGCDDDGGQGKEMQSGCGGWRVRVSLPASELEAYSRGLGMCVGAFVRSFTVECHTRIQAAANSNAYPGSYTSTNFLLLLPHPNCSTNRCAASGRVQYWMMRDCARTTRTAGSSWSIDSAVGASATTGTGSGSRSPARSWEHSCTRGGGLCSPNANVRCVRYARTDAETRWCCWCCTRVDHVRRKSPCCTDCARVRRLLRGFQPVLSSGCATC